MSDPKTTKGKRIIDGLKAAIAYAKGDKSKGKTQRFIVNEHGVAIGVEKDAN